MPVVAAVPAIVGAAGAIGAIGAAAIAPKGKKAAAIGAQGQAAAADAGKWGDRFSGIMAGTSKSVDSSAVDRANSSGSRSTLGFNGETLGSLALKYPENPAFKLAMEADEIFRPQIVGVPS